MRLGLAIIRNIQILQLKGNFKAASLKDRYIVAKKERKNGKIIKKKEKKKERKKEGKKENNKGKVKIVGFVLDNHDHFLVAMFGGNVLINMTNRKEKRWSSILSKNQYR